jgi:hypothetical protein
MFASRNFYRDERKFPSGNEPFAHTDGTAHTSAIVYFYRKNYT